MEYDSPWKEALEHYFEAFMQFFFPKIHSEIDWAKGYEFLDKDLEKIVRDAELGKRIADKLVKVFLSDGKETWLLIHIEIQGYIENKFSHRMYVYNYRLSDRYNMDIVSIAVLIDDDPDFKPSTYSKERFGCEVTFKFPIVKVLSLGKHWKTLEQNINPFAIVVMAHLKAQSLGKGKEEELKRWKLRLTRMLYERGYNRKDILELFRFIDWLIVLPENLEKEFLQELKQTEEDNKMAYITSVQRIGRQEGKLEVAREFLLEMLARRFGTVSDDINQAVNKIKAVEKLKTLLMETPNCENVDKFRILLKTKKK